MLRPSALPVLLDGAFLDAAATLSRVLVPQMTLSHQPLSPTLHQRTDHKGSMHHLLAQVIDNADVEWVVRGVVDLPCSAPGVTQAGPGVIRLPLHLHMRHTACSRHLLHFDLKVSTAAVCQSVSQPCHLTPLYVHMRHNATSWTLNSCRLSVSDSSRCNTSGLLGRIRCASVTVSTQMVTKKELFRRGYISLPKV